MEAHSLSQGSMLMACRRASAPAELRTDSPPVSLLRSQRLSTLTGATEGTVSPLCLLTLPCPHSRNHFHLFLPHSSSFDIWTTVNTCHGFFLVSWNVACYSLILPDLKAFPCQLVSSIVFYSCLILIIEVQQAVFRTRLLTDAGFKLSAG